MMHYIWVVLIGFVVGVVAKWIMPGKEGGGFIMTAILGIAGSFVGGWVFGMLGFSTNVGFVGSVVGALIILWVVKMLGKK
jgi:uncharacterized membrane protein YeaQ/YmgE (transglycosylase-associated protein family)